MGVFAQRRTYKFGQNKPRYSEMPEGASEPLPPDQSFSARLGRGFEQIRGEFDRAGAIPQAISHYTQGLTMGALPIASPQFAEEHPIAAGVAQGAGMSLPLLATGGGAKGFAAATGGFNVLGQTLGTKERGVVPFLKETGKAAITGQVLHGASKLASSVTKNAPRLVQGAGQAGAGATALTGLGEAERRIAGEETSWGTRAQDFVVGAILGIPGLAAVYRARIERGERPEVVANDMAQLPEVQEALAEMAQLPEVQAELRRLSEVSQSEPPQMPMLSEPQSDVRLRTLEEAQIGREVNAPKFLANLEQAQSYTPESVRPDIVGMAGREPVQEAVVAKPPEEVRGKRPPEGEAGVPVAPETPKPIPPSAEAAPVRESAVSEKSEQPTPRSIAMKQLTDAGWNPKWPFIMQDLANPNVVDAIKRDPTLSANEIKAIVSFAPGGEGYKRVFGLADKIRTAKSEQPPKSARVVLKGEQEGMDAQGNRVKVPIYNVEGLPKSHPLYRSTVTEAQLKAHGLTAPVAEGKPVAAKAKSPELAKGGKGKELDWSGRGFSKGYEPLPAYALMGFDKRGAVAMIRLKTAGVLEKRMPGEGAGIYDEYVRNPQTGERIHVGNKERLAELGDKYGKDPTTEEMARINQEIANENLAKGGIEQAARDRIKKRGGKIGSNLVVEEMADYAIIGAAKLARGVRDFGKWSAEMVREFGGNIKPFLRKIYDKARELLTNKEYQKGFIQLPGKKAEAKAVAPEVARKAEVEPRGMLNWLKREMSFKEPESRAPIPESDKKIIESLKSVKIDRVAQERLYHKELSRRAAQMQGIREQVKAGKISATEAYGRERGATKGELPKVAFEGIHGKFTDKEMVDMFGRFDLSRDLSVFDVPTGKEALMKLLGVKIEGEGIVRKDFSSVPTRSEIKLLSEVFHPEVIKAILEKRTLAQRAWDEFISALNLPRAFMSSADLSAPMRQGIFLLAGHPVRFTQSFGRMFRYWGSEQGFQGLMDRIKQDGLYDKIQQGKLAVKDFDVQAEEAFLSKLPNRIPLLRHVYRASNRAYSGFLVDLRYNVFKDMYRHAERLGLTKENPEIVKQIAEYVNTGTGRGSIKHFESAAEVMNGVFFSPRLMSSRLQLIAGKYNPLNPLHYTKLDPFVRKQVLKDLIGFGAMAVTGATIAKMAGADVEDDPRSSDFGKYKIGNTRYDPYGGFQQYVVLGARLATGEIKTARGEAKELGSNVVVPTRLDLAGRFITSKTAPAASFIIDFLRGRDMTGEKFSAPKEVIDRFTPMVLNDLRDIAKDKSWEYAPMIAPAVFGVGVQTYEPRKSKTSRPTRPVRYKPTREERPTREQYK